MRGTLHGTTLGEPEKPAMDGVAEGTDNILNASFHTFNQVSADSNVVPARKPGVSSGGLSSDSYSDYSISDGQTWMVLEYCDKGCLQVMNSGCGHITMQDYHCDKCWFEVLSISHLKRQANGTCRLSGKLQLGACSLWDYLLS